MALRLYNRRRINRVRPPGLPSNAAEIVVEPDKPTIGCTIVDLTAIGACIDLADPDKLPSRFVLVQGATRRDCLLKWKTPGRIGVQFK